MEYNWIRNSPTKVSRIGFGCMSLDPASSDSEKLLQKALEAGITYFDTADLYNQGANESLMGRALSHRRSEYFLCSKVGNVLRPDGSGWDWKPTRPYILSAIEKSLQRLGTTYLDLYLLHGGTMEDPQDEIVEAFETLLRAGKILAYGISSIRPNTIRQYQSKGNLSAVMMQYSLLDRRPEEQCLPFLEKEKIPVFARGVLAQGLLGGKPSKPYLSYPAADVQKIQAALYATGLSQTSAAIQWVLSQPGVGSAVIGIRNEQHLDQAIQAINEPHLSLEQINMLRGVLPPLHYQDHR